jgi:hypothetical protein
MKKPWTKSLLGVVLTAILLALLMQTSAFAAALTFGREKLKGTTSSQGDFATQQQYLTEAQNLSAQAYDKVIAAQSLGKWEGVSHAKKAGELLSQAKNELKLAAETLKPN